jgi:hypothetical protein
VLVVERLQEIGGLHPGDVVTGLVPRPASFRGDFGGSDRTVTVVDVLCNRSKSWITLQSDVLCSGS